jgi:hypothetical protein
LTPAPYITTLRDEGIGFRVEREIERERERDRRAHLRHT